jgi:glutamate-1-semialdehyde 2,1-aminomutase/spore coat polysaccharide biosynthesis protein SpsF
MPKTAVIVQARLGSTRLPAKVLLPLPTGRTVLEEVLFRCKQIPGVDVVVCAIPDTAENDTLCAHIMASSWGHGNVLSTFRPVVVRGPEHDVLARYAKAAEAVNADVIMRVTSDCPLIDPEACGQVLRRRSEGGYAYACNNMPPTFPIGLDTEAFTIGILRYANETATDPLDREHVTPMMRRLAAGADGINVASEVDRSYLRWTLDTLEDYQVIWSRFEHEMGKTA